MLHTVAARHPAIASVQSAPLCSVRFFSLTCQLCGSSADLMLGARIFGCCNKHDCDPPTVYLLPHPRAHSNSKQSSPTTSHHANSWNTTKHPRQAHALSPRPQLQLQVPSISGTPELQMLMQPARSAIAGDHPVTAVSQTDTCDAVPDPPPSALLASGVIVMLASDGAKSADDRLLSLLIAEDPSQLAMSPLLFLHTHSSRHSTRHTIGTAAGPSVWVPAADATR